MQLMLHLYCVPGGQRFNIKIKRCAGRDLVAIHGLGGLGHLAVQYSVKLGLKQRCCSGVEKEDLAYKLGAHLYIDTDAGDAAKQLSIFGGARVILCTAPNSKAISDLIPGLRRNGQAIVVTGQNRYKFLRCFYSEGNVQSADL